MSRPPDDVSAAVAAAMPGGCGECFRAGWAEAQAARPSGELAFLEPATLCRYGSQSAVSPDLVEDLLAAAACVRANPGLSALAWYCHHRLFGADAPDAPVSSWPVPAAAMGRHAGLFYAIVLLSGTPQRQAIHRRLGIPDEVVRDSVADLEVCIRTEPVKELGGRFGISGAILGWLLLTWRGRLYRLGRLQFLPGRFHGRLRAFRHRTTGAVVALAEDGGRFRQDGQVDGAGGLSDPAGAWTARLAESAGQVTGCPISPRGWAMAHRVRLSKAAWAPVLAPGDTVLGIHMAAGAPLTPEACRESVSQALEFFPRYFPEVGFRGFDCLSWLLDPQFPRLLEPTSNLVRFQEEVYVFPCPGGDGAMPWQVCPQPDPATGRAPPPTRMQRAFQAHLAAGGRFLDGGCFLLREDAARWGSRVYLSQPAPWRWWAERALRPAAVCGGRMSGSGGAARC
ncbi:MAG: DUF5596 domain-containing protein [Lentisphaerae bacterium]|nr:DUF5596 domain-containing protein [Lentisphaerota bacterium]